MIPRLLGIEFRSVRCIFEAGRPTEISVGLPELFRRPLNLENCTGTFSTLILKKFDLPCRGSNADRQDEKTTALPTELLGLGYKRSLNSKSLNVDFVLLSKGSLSARASY